MPLPDMDLKLRALEGGKYIHLSLVPLREFKPDEQMTMLPALESISKDEPGFRVIVCDPDQTPPQLMLPHAMPDYATCGQTAPDEGGFRISERYLRFIFRCQVMTLLVILPVRPSLYVFSPVPNSPCSCAPAVMDTHSNNPLLLMPVIGSALSGHPQRPGGGVDGDVREQRLRATACAVVQPQTHHRIGHHGRYHPRHHHSAWRRIQDRQRRR